MAASRMTIRSMRLLTTANRGYRTSAVRLGINERANDTAEQYRKDQKDKPLNPHMTNTASREANDIPKVGADKAPPEFISSVDPNFQPKDAKPENTERMTGGTQKSDTSADEGGDLKVGEIEGGSFRVEPLRRTGEDANTMRARLLYQSRKRGTLESDLLLSTFADTNLASMTQTQLAQYDLFLDENDWDIYYWATQEPPSTSAETAEGGSPELATPAARGVQYPEKDVRTQQRAGEWAQTVGAFKPAYRPVPQRWQGSEILSLLRRHVRDRSAGGVHEVDSAASVDGQGLNTAVRGTGGGGMGFMPPVRNFDV